MADAHLALRTGASLTSASAETSKTLPAEVANCLKNARFVRCPAPQKRSGYNQANTVQLHLATCDALYPHVSLMNYTYLASSPYTSHPTIIMTTNPSSKKTVNMIKNPRVSLLVHDWVSHRPPTTAADPDRSSSPPRQATTSSLATLLLNLNTSALSSISATINGTARIVERGTDEERFFRQRHLENNTFDGGEEGQAGQDGGRSEGDGGRGCYIEGEEVRVVAVRVKDGRIADWKGGVKDWRLEDADEEDDAAGDGVNGMPNGV